MYENYAVPIVFAADNGFAQHTGVAIKSLLMNCSDVSRLRLIVLDGGISDVNKCLIESVCSEHNTKIRFIDIREHLRAHDFKEVKYLGVMTYSRFFIPVLLPEYDFCV